MNSQDSSRKFLLKLLVSILFYGLIGLGIMIGGECLSTYVFHEPAVFMLALPLLILVGLLLPLLVHLFYTFRVSVKYFYPHNMIIKALGVTMIVFFVDILLAGFLLYHAGRLGRMLGFRCLFWFLVLAVGWWVMKKLKIKNEKIKIGLVGLLVIGAVLAGGWWVWENRKLKQPPGGDEKVISGKYCEKDSDCGWGTIQGDPLKYGCILGGEEKGPTGYKCVCNKNYTPPKCEMAKTFSGVTITTNKTEYEQGEDVETTVNNGLNLSIYVDSWKGSWIVLQHQDEEWNVIFSGSAKTLPLCLCENYPDGNCPLWAPPLEKFDEIKSSETVTWSWDQKILKGTDKNCLIWIDAPPGTYKVGLRHFHTLDPNKREWKTIYSNEFTIKEKKLQVVGGPCTYSSYPGECTITRIEKTERSKRQVEIPKCRYEGYEAWFTFKTDRELEKEWAQRTIVEHEDELTLFGCRCTYPGPKYLEKYHIEAGSEHECILRVIESGTCTPIQFEFEQIKRDDCFECLWKD